MNAGKTMARKRKVKITRSDLELWSLLLPAGIMILIFSYIPMYGITMAFTKYKVGSNPFMPANMTYVGLSHFETFIKSIFFKRVLVNTLRLSILNLMFGFTIPIIFALLLNEVRAMKYKKFVQTASYLPYFISTVVVSGMMLSFLENEGLINSFLHAVFGLAPKEYIAYAEYYPTIYTVTNVWKGFGFNSILYFSTISSIDPNLYEAARMDGANRWKQMLYVTLPGIKFIVAIQLVLSVGHLLSTNTELALLLYRPATYSTSDVIGTFIFRNGIENGKYSYTAAVGLFMSVFGMLLTIIANKASNKISGYGMW